MPDPRVKPPAPKPVSAKAVVRAIRGNKAPPKSPEHALVRVAMAAQTRSAVPCSRFGAPGGMYLGVMGDVRKGGKRAGGSRGALQTVPVGRRTAAPGLPKAAPKRPAPQTLAPRPAYKVRRVSTQEAHAIVRRPGGPDNQERLRGLYWIPPELVALYPRPALADMVLRGQIRPVWTSDGGRVVHRGEGVLAVRLRR